MSKHVRAPLTAATTERLEYRCTTGFVRADLEIATLASLPDVDTVDLCSRSQSCFQLLAGTALASRTQRVRFANRSCNAQASGFRGNLLAASCLDTCPIWRTTLCQCFCLLSKHGVIGNRTLVGQPLAAERRQTASSGQRFVVFKVGRSV